MTEHYAYSLKISSASSRFVRAIKQKI